MSVQCCQFVVVLSYFTVSARRYCDPLCLLVGWFVRSCVNQCAHALVRIWPPAAMTDGRWVGVQWGTALHAPGVVRALFLVCICYLQI